MKQLQQLLPQVIAKFYNYKGAFIKNACKKLVFKALTFF